MAHHLTVLNQIISLISRNDFEKLAKEHQTGQKFRKFDRWSQFITMMSAQLCGRKSLRDIENTMKAQSKKLYHLGVKPVSRSTLARFNEEQSCELFGKLFYKLLSLCKTKAHQHHLDLKEKVFLLDGTVIDLCLNLFPWAEFRRNKGAVKVNVGLDTNGYLPTFVTITEGKKHEVSWARISEFPKGSILVFDRGFVDYQWWEKLTKSEIFFVSRLKKNALFDSTNQRELNQEDKESGVISDQEVILNKMEDKLRLVEFVDQEGHQYHFITNAFHLSAKKIADLYKERWKIELFFKWIKQNLKIKSFLGTSKNAVMSQIWIAMCAYLIIAYLTSISKIKISMKNWIDLLHTTLFERRSIETLFSKPKVPIKDQLTLIY